MKKVLITTSIIITLLCFIIGITTRLSYRDLLNENIEKIDSFQTSIGRPFVSDQINTFDDLFKKSLIVVKAKKKKWEMQYKAIYSTFDVIKTYKIPNNWSSQEINVYEPCYFNMETNWYIPLGGYVLMQNNREYYMFLNPKIIEGTQKVKNQDYVLTTQDSFSKYPYSEELTSFISNNNLNTFSQIKDKDIVSNNNEALKAYFECFEQVKKMN